jgi:hypothetical protein
MRRGDIVLVDTNIIIEAVRTQCWNALTGYFTVETVEKCREESLAGHGRRPGYVVVPAAALEQRVTIHRTTDMETVELAVRDPESNNLDLGERYLWAHALKRHDNWFACCADQAAVLAAIRLGWRDRLVSLEALADGAGAKGASRQLKEHFRTARLSAWRTAALLQGGL